MDNIEKNIIVSGIEEIKAVLKKLEKQEYRWCNGDKPTRYMPPQNTKSLQIWSSKDISYLREKEPYSGVISITAKEFLNKGECIVIYRNGSETIALDKTTGEKAVAKCHPDDEYNLYKGAELALDRLMGKKPPFIREVKRAAKVGEYIKIVNACSVPRTNGKPEYKNGDILKVLNVESEWRVRYGIGRADNLERVVNKGEYVVLEGYKPPEVEEFKPYLTCSGKNYGIIGDKTPIKDVLDRELRVGDTVEIYYKGELRREKVVVKNDSKAFVMGISVDCNMDGTIDGSWKIIKKRGHEDIAHGDKVGEIMYIKER